MTEERALATLETITELIPIENADSIQIAKVRGWNVVVRIGEFQVGDPVVYFELDSFLPLDDPRFTFLAPRGARKNSEGVEGHVLKTAKMRGIYSQGLVMPWSDFPETMEPEGWDMTQTEPVDADSGLLVQKLGSDLTPYIKGVEKWDPPIPAELAGSAKGPFPSVFRKTDEERIQNIAWVFDEPEEMDQYWIATEKIDGSSMTVYLRDGEVGVASRNWDLEETSHNTQWKLAYNMELFDYLRGSGLEGSNIAIQGEIFGPGIQGNPLQVKEYIFRAFTLQVDGEELPRSMWPAWLLDIAVPVHPLPYPHSVEEALAQVENLPSLINPQRPVEGVVWRNTLASRYTNGARASWKAISQRYLLRHDR